MQLSLSLCTFLTISVPLGSLMFTAMLWSLNKKKVLQFRKASARIIKFSFLMHNRPALSYLGLSDVGCLNTSLSGSH